MAANTNMTEDQVRGFFTSLSNWGKWGATDQLGALNYVTPEKRRRAPVLKCARDIRCRSPYRWRHDPRRIVPRRSRT